MKNNTVDKWTFKENSLDLLRLVAACQVMVLHSFEFTMPGATGTLFFEVLRLFPGVPIFFFISGYLISRSFERAPNLQTYFKNRGLRIFPALIVVVFVNLLMVWSTGYFEGVDASMDDIILLFMAKASFLQFYNPEFMRSFGDGVLNGSLWTICVELQFYILVPFLYRFVLVNKAHTNLILIGLIFFCMILNRLLYLWAPEFSESVIWKLYRVSFLPWVYMFLFGALVQRNFDFFSSLLSGLPALPLTLGYLVVMYVVSESGVEFGNSIPPYIYFPLALLVFRLAYAFINVSASFLRGNDLSYGIYIWHMPLVNQLLYMKDQIGVLDVILIIVGSVLLAALSWFTIEKHALQLKHASILRARTRT